MKIYRKNLLCLVGENYISCLGKLNLILNLINRNIFSHKYTNIYNMIQVNLNV